jgi:DNA polymerase III gamma/tau subunit
MFSIKYRPGSFAEFIGNQSEIQGLIKKYPDWPSTFLLVGPPGGGKTSLARLIAQQLKCEEINIKEIDAGQDRGIDNIRRISESAKLRPLIGTTKIYIFDECQGLTADAQQALLKITEEAPRNTYFVFCSTDPQKIIKALQSRCQSGRINLLPVLDKELGLILKNICEKEKIELTETIKKIGNLCIENADGIPRNVIMDFEKYYGYPSVEEVAAAMKNSGDYIPPEIWDLVNALEKDFPTFLKLFSDTKRGNYESFRITMGNIFKKKLLNAMIKQEPTEKLIIILSMFTESVDNQLGDIELIYRFSKYGNVASWEA